MPVLVRNLQEKVHLSKEEINRVCRLAEIVLAEEGLDGTVEVNVVFTDDHKIHHLNRQYRRMDQPTDVLSFSMREGETIPGDEEGQMLGDVVISLETALRQAGEYGHELGREVAYLTVHGVLHLAGYDHQDEKERQTMRKREEEILEQFNLSR